MMKYLDMNSSIYKKFFDLAKIVSDNKYNDKNLSNLLEKSNQLGEFIISNNKGKIEKEEAYFRIMNYIILDNMNLIDKYIDNSKEIEIFKNNIIGIFEVIEKTDNFVKFLDVSNGKTYDLVGDIEGSEKTLNDLFVGNITISRFLQLDDGWYSMKHFYYIISKEENGYEEIKIAYKSLFSGIKNYYDVEERMTELNKISNKTNIITNINYLKRIKGILLKPLGKKKFAEVEKILTKKDINSYGDFFEYISKVRLTSKEKEDLKEYVSGYLKDKENNKKEEKEKMFKLRLEMVLNSFFQYLNYINYGIPTDRKFNEKESAEIEEIKQKWFNEKNSLYSNKTPLEFLHELNSEYALNNLKIIHTSKEELEFYDGYDKMFTDEESEIYKKGIEKAENQDATAYLDFEKLMEKHGEFFRLRANYIMTRYHFIFDVYGFGKNEDYKVDVDILKNDRDFINKIEDEINYVKRLKHGYKFYSGFEKFVKDTLNNLKLGMGLKFFSLDEDFSSKMIEKGNDNEIIDYLKTKIKDFSLDELIEKIKLYTSTFVTWQYEEEDRFFDNLNGIDENFYIKLFDHLWDKYKKPEYLLCEDIKDVYDDIMIIKEGDNSIFDYNKIDEFGDIIDKLLKQANKENILEWFESFIEVGELIEAEYIIEEITDDSYKNKFIDILKKIDYKFEL